MKKTQTDMNNQLTEYIKAALAEGTDEATIKKNLAGVGWPVADVAAAWSAVSAAAAPAASIMDLATPSAGAPDAAGGVSADQPASGASALEGMLALNAKLPAANRAPVAASGTPATPAVSESVMSFTHAAARPDPAPEASPRHPPDEPSAPQTWQPPRVALYSPWAMALLNVLFLGVGYLVMRLYKRFFAVYGIAVAIAAIAVPLGIYQLFVVLALIVTLPLFIIIDCAVQAGRLNAGKRTQQDGSAGLVILAIMLNLAFSTIIGFTIYASVATEVARLGWRVEGLSVVALADERASADCERFRQDASLKVGEWNFGRNFAAACYFRKAVETKDAAYCAVSGAVDAQCVEYLAATQQKPEICDRLATDVAKQGCRDRVSRKDSAVPDYCGPKQMAASLAAKCETEFGAFLKTLVPAAPAPAPVPVKKP